VVKNCEATQIFFTFFLLEVKDHSTFALRTLPERAKRGALDRAQKKKGKSTGGGKKGESLDKVVLLSMHSQILYHSLKLTATVVCQ
jgi:hypothetical protein